MNYVKLALQWGCQIFAGVILIQAGLGKLQGTPGDIELFTELSMEPGGRVIIGICELVAGVGLFHPLSAAFAAFLGAGVLTGAGLAHLGPLGFGETEMFIATYASVLIVVTLRWSELPFAASHRRR